MASKEYQAELQNKGIVTSMSRKGICYDNACIESFYSLIKRGLIFHENYVTQAQAKQGIFKCIVHFYNYKRIYTVNG